MIKDLEFINFLTTSIFVDLLVILIFRIINRIKKYDSAINSWYINLRWTVVILYVLSFMIGFYISYFIYKFLIENNYINNKYEFVKYLAIVLLVQIIHDFCFYFFVIKPFPRGKNDVMDEFKSYAEANGINAVIGDSLMYIIGTPLLYISLKKMNTNTNIFTSIISLYLIGYLIYQKK